MKITLILMIIFSDTQAPLQRTIPVPDGPKACVGMIWGMMVDGNGPPAKFGGHPVKSWSATCIADGIGEPL